MPPAPDSPARDRGAVTRLRAIGRWSALFAGALAVAVLVSYPLGVPIVRSLGNPIEVQPNAGLGILLVAMALLLRDAGRVGRAASVVLGAAAAAIGLATLLEHVSGVDLHIDLLLRRDLAQSPGTTSPGRMGPPAAASLIASGVALVLLSRARRAAAAQAL
ncbi:MAG: hypothetical protein ACM3NW_05885, partial [Syntrophomonadaceae bacterium]